MNDNLRAFLWMIRECEGTAEDDGYQAMFGYPMAGRTFTDFADHPRRKFPFKQTDGTMNYTTAAGAYQEIVPTFNRLTRKLGTVGFDPEVQDQHAAELIAEAGAMADVKNGNLRAAIDKCSGVWASLPASKYPQPKRTYAFAENAYLQSGGKLS